MKPVLLRRAAGEDITNALQYCVDEAGNAVAERFIDAVESGFVQLGEFPLSGSQRFAYALGIPELRSWRLRSFPYVVFYVDRSDRVEVWRVLHERRDIGSALADEDQDDEPEQA